MLGNFFVYGTLKSGETRDMRGLGAKLLCEATVRGRIFISKLVSFPMGVLNPDVIMARATGDYDEDKKIEIAPTKNIDARGSGVICGEIYSVEDDRIRTMLNLLDSIEGFQSVRSENLFNRFIVSAEDSAGNVIPAWFYEMNSDYMPDSCVPLVSPCVWGKSQSPGTILSP